MHITEFIILYLDCVILKKKSNRVNIVGEKLDQYSNFNVYSQTQVQCGKGC